MRIYLLEYLASEKVNYTVERLTLTNLTGYLKLPRLIIECIFLSRVESRGYLVEGRGYHVEGRGYHVEGPDIFSRAGCTEIWQIAMLQYMQDARRSLCTSLISRAYSSCLDPGKIWWALKHEGAV